MQKCIGIAVIKKLGGKLMKKITALICSAILCAGTLAVGGCNAGGETAEKSVMNLSLNPEVEFVLDADNKVVSVNALNEEGNLIVQAEAFTGKTADEAAKLFVQVSKDTGFLVSGTVSNGENEIEISISGNEKAATELYNSVKSEVQEYLTAENVTAQIEKATIDKEDLQELVAECAPYLEAAEIQAMEYSALVEEILASRKETAEFYSQEIKEAYYQAKAVAMEQAELEALKGHLGEAQKYIYDATYTAYSTAIELIESTRKTMLVEENSPYQLALTAFRTAKTDYVNYRNYVASLEQTEITTAITTTLDNYETVLDSAEDALESAKETAETALATAKTQVKTAYNAVVAFLDSASVKASDYLDEISTKQKQAQTAFFTQFETAYATAIAAAETNWANMKTALENGGAAAE